MLKVSIHKNAFTVSLLKHLSTAIIRDIPVNLK